MLERLGDDVVAQWRPDAERLVDAIDAHAVGAIAEALLSAPGGQLTGEQIARIYVAASRA